MMRKDIRCVSVIFDRHVDVWRDQSAIWFHAFFTDSTPSPYAQLRTSVSIWISASLRHSNVTPRASFSNGSFWLSQDTLLHILSQTTDDLSWTICVFWSTSIDSSRVQRLRFCQHVDVILSFNTVSLPTSLSHLFTISWPLLVLASLAFRTRSVDFSTEPNELLSTLRCFGHIVRFDLVHLPAHLFWRRTRLTTRICGTFSWSWPVYHHKMGTTLRRLWNFWRCRTFWDGRFCHVDAGLFVGTGQMETSTRRTSADLLCDNLSILSRSPGPLHYHRPLSRVFSPCRWVTTLTRTESGRLHLIFMRGSLMWTGSEMSQMSFSPHVWSRRLCPFDFCHMSRSDDGTLTLLEVRFGAQRGEQLHV